MTRPGFRRGRPGGASAKAAEGGDGFLSTSLFSQAQILHLMKNEFARARRHGVPLGCALLQVDRLHQLVDLHGVELRQAVRTALAQLVRDKTRGADLLGTMNDDRYLLLLPHTELAQTHVVAARLQQLFADLEIKVDGRELALSLSIGITACSDQSTLFFDTFVAQAEAALEHALAHGGNQVVSFGQLQLQGGEPGGDAGREGAR
ncbi:MAG: diguanylate cyclase [Planctomycetes bacterium]|nr:diguanylate cyclase [Planctomycetota bacterium]